MKDQMMFAAEIINNSDAILIGAGAGMGIDSNLPDFRGKNGFWNAYPQLEQLNKSFLEMTNGDLFLFDPVLAWWFYGHRFNLYRKTQPHEGFRILKQLSLSKPMFVFTSNVDGHFQKAGFTTSQVIECHGNINYLQCAFGCSDEIWPITGLPFTIDKESCSINGNFPRCSNCGGIARPNILMFADQWWIKNRTTVQMKNLNRWLDADAKKNIVSIELGAGTTIPSVRIACSNYGHSLIRINTDECEVTSDQIPIKKSALSALIEINKLLI